MPRRRPRALFCLLLACAGAACQRRDAQRPVESDLLALFRYTESGQDTAQVDFGTPQAAPYLGAGWSEPDKTDAGDSVARAVAREAVVNLPLGAPADRILAVRFAALHLPSKRPAAVIVRVNNRRIATLSVSDTMAEQRIALPGRAQRRGENEIAFCARLGRGDERLDVAYDVLRVLSATGEPRTIPQLDGDALTLPPRSSVSYFLRLPESPVLQVAAADGGGASRLTVRLQREDAEPQTLFDGDGTAPAADVRIDGHAGELVRVALDNDSADPVRISGALLRGSEPAPAAAPGQASGAGMSVLLYVVDTLRADHLGCYGYGRPTSPHIDAFARQATLFAHTVAQSSWTRPAVGSILTGRYPPAHGATTLRRGLRFDVPTLAELLRARGYRTAAFVTNVNVAPQWGFQRGFDLYRYLPEDEHTAAVHVRSDILNGQAVDWLTEHGDQPFFLYVHATDPHAPYTPPPPFAERLADPGVAVAPERVDALLSAFRERGELPSDDEVRALAARYDGEIAFTDQNFGRLIGELARLGLDRRTLVILVADHGEEFADHGSFEHGHTLYEEMLHVPLLMRYPDGAGAGRHVSSPARQIDIVPTVLDYLGVALPTDLPGRSLVPAVHGVDLGPVDALAETRLARRGVGAIVTGDWKVIEQQDAIADRVHAYDLRVDPREREDRAPRPVLVGYARQALAAWGGARPRNTAPAAEPPPDPALMERLRALGYTE